MSSHLIRGRQLSRDTEHRLALRRNLCQSLFEHGKVKTTLPKAKEVKAMAEKLITLARQNTLNSRRKVISLMRDRRLVDENQDFIEEGPTRTIVQKLFNDIAPSFADRPGGYTRIIKTAKYRIGDGGTIVLLQLLTEKSEPRGTARRSAGLRRKRNERRHQFATKALKESKASAKSETKAETASEAQSGDEAPKAE